MPDNYDLAIIGSGPGGYVAAIRAGQLGLKTVVVEKDDKLGGTCLHVGCIPTKSLLHNAEVYEYVRDAREYGIECGEPKLDWSVVQARKDRIVKKHAKGIEFLLKKNKVDTVRGWGRLAGGGRVLVEQSGGAGGNAREITAQQVAGTREITARAIVLASGSEARMLPGLQPQPGVVLTNREILELKQVPPRAGDCRGRRRGSRVCLDLPFIRRGRDAARDAPAHCPVRRRGNLQGA